MSELVLNNDIDSSNETFINDVNISESALNYSDCTSDEGSLGLGFNHTSSFSLEDENNDYVPGSFEGPEKTMEVLFATDKGHENGLRALNRKQLDYICTKAKCSILTKSSNSYIDAYVLSESSMFIYKHRFIMKTCGTTTLLRCLGALIEFADNLGMEIIWVRYNRKNLNNPGAQLWPHSSFNDEIKYLDSHEKLQQRLKGSGHVLGSVTGDHWFFYVADPTPEVFLSLSAPTTEKTVNIMMFDMAPEVAEIFFQSTGLTGKEMTEKSGINTLCPGAVIDETSFCPCGYSMNAILHDAYSTIHVTPEAQCSYVSFETNTSLRDYSALIRNVLHIFRPKRFVLTLFGDEGAVNNMVLPMSHKSILVPSAGCYNRSTMSSTSVESEVCCYMGCYSIDDRKVISPQEITEARLRDRGESIC
mmetsp:Transcript_8220/g.7360  ORF Transcript_8220/g.7360 Transcript_8220/m.7360 type:complete len:418 (+) Transcript_8220:61-1314(+)